MQMQFRVVYEVYKTQPCEHDEYLRNQVERILDHEHDLRKMKAATQRLKLLLSKADWTKGQLALLLEGALADLASPQQPLGRTLDDINRNSDAWRGDQP